MKQNSKNLIEHNINFNQYIHIYLYMVYIHIKKKNL